VARALAEFFTNHPDEAGVIGAKVLAARDASQLRAAKQRLYRDIQGLVDRSVQGWELQDRILQALADASGDVAAAAKALNLSEGRVRRVLKPLGLGDGGS
jgi:hypothetical protein